MINSRLKKQFFLLIIFTFVLVGYSLRDGPNGEEVVSKSLFVDRVVDGDTFESNGSKFRLLGINTPEKNERFYQEAKNYLMSFENNFTIFDFYTKSKITPGRY